ncbi:hypothetical protein M407DRAFT_242814 [Tulasnella calospora MUT 4182]|uniref:Uncharacterized protein n=1 Tax=Tulasnella calospora MUT 4182 TaxID=1051891 RepID=A0A0C3QM76_9AGAM|nr:hypothetical protein M407DRAFT_242814 [Tulasnella calospora MUT 4182]
MPPENEKVQIMLNFSGASMTSNPPLFAFRPFRDRSVVERFGGRKRPLQSRYLDISVRYSGTGKPCPRVTSSSFAHA